MYRKLTIIEIALINTFQVYAINITLLNLYFGIMRTKNRPYRPSNGTEGAYFMEKFCERCAKEPRCKIILDTMIFEVDDPEYPKQWTYDKDNNPVCTAFKLPEPRRKPTDPNQTKLL